MKKNTFFALVMFMSVIGAVFGQTPATLPYSCDFEASGDNGWTLKNGTCTSKWHVGSFTSPAGHSGSLFISSDGGTTAGYNINAESVVVAEKLFQTGTSDSLTISFDLTVEGETSNDAYYVYDYLKVFWVPADTVYEASTSWTYYANTEYSTNIIMSNSPNALNYTLNLTNGEERMSVTIANEPNTLKKLVFVWANDNSDGEQPGAIIDNISIIAPPTLTPLPYSCDFEASGDNGWTLKNGTCTNKWHVGSFTSPAGHSGSLFISSDGGTTAGYNINAGSVVVAEKLFQTGTSDSLTISFDLTVKGEGIYDYLKVFWVDTNVNYEASASFPGPNYASYYYSNNVIMGTTYLNNLSATTRVSTTIANEPNTLKKLVFVWANDNSDGEQPGAIIDNISIIAPPTLTPLPYSCDFEASGDNGWTLKNGTCTNKWHVGSFTSPAGHSGSLFISSDGGTTAGYDVNAESVVVAEKLFQTGTSDSLTISFDLTIVGEGIYDYLKVFWVPADTAYEASSSWRYYAGAKYSTNIIMSNATDATNYTVNMLIGTQNMSATIANEVNTLKKLVFLWRNDDGGGTQPGAIIDNIYISDCIIPTDFIASNITQTSADVSWNGTATGYQIRLNGGTPETVSTTSKTFTGLTAGTAYTVEVRSLCGSNNSAWKRIEFYTSQLPTTLPYTCDFEASGDNGWLLKNVTYTNQWHVGSFTSPAGHSGSLFISSDGGTTADYDIDAYSVVVAEKLFQTGTSDSLTISFDLTIGGEDDYDYLKVFWVPADTVYQTSILTPYFANAEYSTNIIMSNAASATNYTVNMLTGTQNMSATIANEPNTLKKLVFVWVNDFSDGEQPGAIIDNISIVEVGNIPEPCDAPTALTASNITETSAEVSWNGTATGYAVRLNGGTPEIVTATSKTFTGLTAGTAYTVEVRAVCESSNSAVVSTSFTTQNESGITAPSVNTLAASNITHDGATLNGTITAGSEAITAQGFMYKASSATDWTTVAATGTNLSATVNNLTAETAYEYKAFATTASGTIEGAVESFTTLAAPVVVTPPTVETLAATEVTHEAATLNGTITAGSEAITAQGFMYKASSAADWTTVAATGTNLSATVNNLTAETAYEYKAFATTASGTVEGAVESFTTTAAPVVVTPPTVETLAATEITHEAATLNGTITAGSEAITAQGFMYKASSATDWTTVAATGTTITATVNNLTAETAYEYKAFATTASSTVEGEVINFTTLAASGLADAESGAIKAMIYPNPAKDKATLSLTGLTANAKIIVSDLQGRIIQTEDLQAGTETYELNTSNYASGVYYIRILCGNNINTQKLIIE